VRFVVPSLEGGANPEDGHEIGGCELDLMDLGDEGQESVVRSLDVQDSTEVVIGFVELEVSMYMLKVREDVLAGWRRVVLTNPTRCVCSLDGG
jgi:hypothetical protein